MAQKSFFGQTVSAELWIRLLTSARNMAFIWTPSMKICLRSYRDLELTAVRSLPMSIGGLDV